LAGFSRGFRARILIPDKVYYLEGLSVEETLRKAGVLSEDYWLKSK
jgi:hypothetical protein